MLEIPKCVKWSIPISHNEILEMFIINTPNGVYSQFVFNKTIINNKMCIL